MLMKQGLLEEFFKVAQDLPHSNIHTLATACTISLFIFIHSAQKIIATFLLKQEKSSGPQNEARSGPLSLWVRYQVDACAHTHIQISRQVQADKRNTAVSRLLIS